VTGSLLEDIKTKQLQWYGHVQRMEEGRLPKEVLEWRPSGRRKRGRPKLTWAEGIRGMMGEKGLKEEDWADRNNVKWAQEDVKTLDNLLNNNNIQTFLNDTSSSTKPTYISLEPNPRLRGQTPVTNYLRQDTDIIIVKNACWMCVNPIVVLLFPILFYDVCSDLYSHRETHGSFVVPCSHCLSSHNVTLGHVFACCT